MNRNSNTRKTASANTTTAASDQASTYFTQRRRRIRRRGCLPRRNSHCPGGQDEENLMLLDVASRIDKWTRPALCSGYVSQSLSIIFQQLEIDYVIEESHKELLPDRSGAAAIIRIFGVTREGNSVCCHVHGFEPYFYISCPPGMGPDDISCFHQILEGRMRDVNRNSKAAKFVLRIELVQKRSIMYYQQQPSYPFLNGSQLSWELYLKTS